MAEKKYEPMAEEKCAFCGGAIMYKPYTETFGDKVMSFHAKACADALKSMKFPRCAFCEGVIAYEPYVESIKGQKLAFHAKACADAYKKK